MPVLPAPNVPNNGPHVRLLARQDMQPVANSDQQVAFSPAVVGVIVTIFTVALILPVVWVRIHRRRRAHRTPPPPKAAPQLELQDRDEARRTLEGVAEVLSVEKLKALRDGEGGGDGTDGESRSESASVLDRECAICLSALCPLTPPSWTLTRRVTETLSFSAPARAATMSEPSQILRLRTCRHEFHEECLLGWFLMRKYSCPICRAVYYVDPVEKEEGSASASASASARSSIGGNSEAQEGGSQGQGGQRSEMVSGRSGHVESGGA